MIRRNLYEVRRILREKVCLEAVRILLPDLVLEKYLSKQGKPIKIILSVEGLLRATGTSIIGEYVLLTPVPSIL